MTGTTLLWYLVTYPILRRKLGYTNDQQLHHRCHLMTLGVQVRFLQYVYMSMFNALQPPTRHVCGNQSARDFRRSLVLTWMHDNIELVCLCDIME